MVTRLEHAELQEFLEAEVRDGRFPSVDAAIEAAVRQMKWDVEHTPALDEQTLQKLDEADAAVARGEFYTLDQVRAMFAAKLERRA